MKFLNKRSIMILGLLSLLISTTNSLESYLSSQNFLSASLEFSNSQNATNSTSAPAADAAAGNATAGNGTASKIVASDPYTITTCDQTLQISAQTLVDVNDFTKKSPAFFTLSVYLLNIFEKQDINTLIQSVSLNKIITLPQIIPGSVSCINFSNGKKPVTMCLPDKNQANNVIKAFSQIMKCRMGDNLKDTPVTTIQNILKTSCLGLDVGFDIDKFKGDLNLARASLQTAMITALKNAAKNLKSAIIAPKKEDINAKLDGKAQTK